MHDWRRELDLVQYILGGVKDESGNKTCHMEVDGHEFGHKQWLVLEILLFL